MRVHLKAWLPTLLVYGSIAAFLGVLVGSAYFSELFAFGRLRNRMSICVERFQSARPEGIPPAVWEHAAGWTNNACNDVCFAAGHVSLEAMQAFVEDLERKLDADPIDVETLYWIWDYLQRIEPTGVHGNSDLSHRWKPVFVEALGDYAPAGR